MTKDKTTPRLYNFGVAAFLGLVLLFAAEECDDDERLRTISGSG